MTCYRQKGTVNAVLLDVINELSPAAIDKLTGKSADHFYNVSNPRTRWGLHLEDAAGLDAALILAGLPTRFGPLLESLTSAKVNGKATGVCLDHALRGVMACVGDLAREIDKAFEDGKLDLHERRTLATIAQAGMDLFQQIRDEVEPPHTGPQEVA